MANPIRSQKNDGGTDISIIGPRMKVVGDLSTQGTVRVEGRVEGDVEAGKAVVVGKGGEIHGDVRTQDCVVSGRITGSLIAGSRLEVQATAQVDGEVHARRLQLEEGALLNGTVKMGEVDVEARKRSTGVPSGSSGTVASAGSGPVAKESAGSATSTSDEGDE